MPIFIIGCGRSGTNMILESLSGSKELEISNPEENKNLIKKDNLISYPKNYLTKCDTWYIEPEAIGDFLKNNPDGKIIFTMRDPRDLYMSKVRRGQTYSNGGDCYEIADDSTDSGFEQDFAKMKEVFKNLINFEEKILLLKMEEYIIDQEETLKRICEFCEIEYVEEMKNFMSRMRNPFKKERYSGLDKNEVFKWKNWKKAYGGWFVENGYDLDSKFESIKSKCKEFDYE